MTSSTPTELPVAYAVSMRALRHASRVLATVALVVGALIGWGGAFSSHCDSNEAASGKVMSHDHSGSATLAATAWAKQNSHQCEHCPPSECSRVAPCSSSSTMLSGASLLPQAGLPEHASTLVGDFYAPPSSVIQPPTPPPQVVS